ncbi:retropepsin-like aspartic protease family protein [Robertkochia solimangrovi]|uniref:retropepsin-like aspartic protease family protein n=1 Tax=Robertkochia solimangrovi TaxID=2213046 RepID=UPI00117C1AAE|nr:retropepsin-like aspartic protease [Robertkochia solimangrovi]TRZ46359.1 acid protease [Robertkochia solimangrovi]
MQSLKKLLKSKGYESTPLTLTKTNHFEVRGSINGIEGRFILDTGASSTCIGLDCIDHFNLTSEDSEIKATGAGASNMLTQVSKKNMIEIGNWSVKKIKLVLFDLTHVNAALTEHDALPVHGIIGADILRKGKAVIDYNKKMLHLKG